MMRSTDQIEQHFKATHMPDGSVSLQPDDWEAVKARIVELEGLKPQGPPRPPHGTGLPRYGLRWNGPTAPLAVPMDDGYWTPWHLAQQIAESSDKPADLDESVLWSVLEAATEAMDRKAVPHAWLSLAWDAGSDVIVRRRAADNATVSTGDGHG